MAQGQIGAAIFIFEPHVIAGNPSPELRDYYSQALLAANRLAEAEPLIWQLFEQNPGRLQQVVTLIGKMVDCQQDAEAVALARKLEMFQRRRGERRAFVATMQDLIAGHRSSPEMLEFLSELFNSSNRENDYCQTLLKLFDLYVSTGNFQKAGECLDRAADVDPYERGHQKRLEILKGKIPDDRFKVIASRLSQMNKSVSGQPACGRAHARCGGLAGPDAAGGNPGAVRNADEGGRAAAAHSGVVSAGGRAKRRSAATVSGGGSYAAICGYGACASRARGYRCSGTGRGHCAVPAAVHGEQADVSSFTRVAEITRKLYHQNNANAVLATAANEIGGQWKVDALCGRDA